MRRLSRIQLTGGPAAAEGSGGSARTIAGFKQLRDTGQTARNIFRAAGFTTGKPWFYVNPNYTFINAEAEEKDPLSILNFYRRCLLQPQAPR